MNDAELMAHAKELASLTAKTLDLQRVIASEKQRRQEEIRRDKLRMRRIDESIERAAYRFNGQTQPFGGYLSKPETGQFDANGAYVPLWKRDPAFIRQQEDAMVDRLRDYRIRLEERKLIGA